jgi:hypothetical protein
MRAAREEAEDQAALPDHALARRGCISMCVACDKQPYVLGQNQPS